MPVEHLIVLMLENRSFDHLLGFVPHDNPAYDGLKGTESCPAVNGDPITVSPNARYEIGSPDHSHAGTLEQLGDGNRGFVVNYAKRAGAKAADVMRCFDPRMVPVMSTLAREFAVCTRWFCSLPGETWPNREFAHSGTSRGLGDIILKKFYSYERTIFEQVAAAGNTYRIYHDDTPHTWQFANLWETWEKRGRFRPIRKLYEDIEQDQLSNYTFVEPDYGVVGSGNSQHPGQSHTRDEFLAGERLVHNIYDKLRRNPAVFAKTVFIITYDEHGGFYDHVSPPAAISPDSRTYKGFKFDRLGARVPTVIVSPLIPRGTVDSTVYDHTSIIQTVRSMFASGQGKLKERDAKASVFRGLWSLAEPRTDLPVTRALTPAEGAALEAEIAPLTRDRAPAVTDEDEPTEFLDAMRALSESVGVALAREAAATRGGPRVALDPADPADVLTLFRATSVSSP